MNRLALLALLAFTLPSPGQSPPPRSTEGGTATEPAERPGAAMEMHEKFLERAKKGDIDLLFLGDSITQGWNDNGTWQRHYAPRQAANFGIGGDRTQHVLWRLDHGEVDGIEPKVIVLMIGTNNFHSNTPEEIAEGIRAIVQTLRVKLPASRILLLGIFPRGESPMPGRERIAAVNSRIARLDDGKSVTYLDVGPVFIQPDGKIARDVMPDFLHLSEKGYRIWADAMEPTLWSLLEGAR